MRTSIRFCPLALLVTGSAGAAICSEQLAETSIITARLHWNGAPERLVN